MSVLAPPTVMRSNPLGLAPFFFQIEGAADSYFEDYNPNPLETRYQTLMHRQISESLQDRQQYEHQWEFAASRFNLLASPIKDERLSNTLIPLIKIVVMARNARLMKGEMDVTYMPGHDDGDLVDVWQDARRYVNSKCNYTYEMQRAYMTMSLFGNAPLYDGYRAQYATQLIPNMQGGYKEQVFRDPAESKIFTESIMPWQYLVHPGGRDLHDAPSHTYTRYMHYDAWIAEFARIPKTSGKPLYMHTKSVRPGIAWKYNGAAKTWVKQELSHQMVCVNYHWIPTMGIHMIESNGVLNWLGPNPYKHGRAPFNMLRLHPQMDPSGMQYARYWQGDAWLLSGLDTLYQNVGNMFVDNFYFSNSSIIGVPTGVNLDIEDEEFYGATIIRGADKIVQTPLGRLDGESYNFAFKVLNDMCVWATSVPFNQLVPEGQVTAAEFYKRIDLANEGMAAVMRNNAAYALKGSEEQKISNIFQFLPKEEFYAVSDPDAVDRLVKEGKIADNDIVYEDGVAVMVRSWPMIETKGRVIKEHFVNNFPVPDKAEIIEKGRSGRLAARPENILPVEWLRNNGRPDVIIDTDPMFGGREEIERQKVLDDSTFMLAQNDRARMAKKPDVFKEDEIYEDMLRVMKKNPRKLLAKNTDSGVRMGQDVDTREVERQMRSEIAMQEQTQPMEEPMMPEDEVAPAPNMPAGGQGPQTQQGQMQRTSQEISSAMTGQ